MGLFCNAVAAFSIPPAAAPGPGGLQTRVLGPPSSRQERIAPGVAPGLAPVQAPAMGQAPAPGLAPVQAPAMGQAPAPGLRVLGPGVTSAANVPIVVAYPCSTHCGSLVRHPFLPIDMDACILEFRQPAIAPLPDILSYQATKTAATT